MMALVNYPSAFPVAEQLIEPTLLLGRAQARVPNVQPIATIMRAVSSGLVPEP